MDSNNYPLHFYSHGKLLLTGEYLVLDGALALALPTRQGQSLRVERPGTQAGVLDWKSYTEGGQCWFSGRFALPQGTFLEGTDVAVGERLEQILQAGKALQPLLWERLADGDISINTSLEFPRNWGLGTSSTLIANLAKWWGVDPYQLLDSTFGGSGYDLACAGADSPLFYRIEAGKPIVSSVDFTPTFHDQLYFLYLEKKQNSRSGIASYRNKGRPPVPLLDQISSISRKVSRAGTLTEFCDLLEEHERIIGNWMEVEPVKEQLFANFAGTIKSLGAWGGDFVLVASQLAFPEIKRYFSDRSYPTILRFSEMVLPLENAAPNSN